MKPEMEDDDGREVREGDTVVFSYGITPVRVVAPVENIDGSLWAITKGHKPEKCKLSSLRKHVGAFYKQTTK